MGKHITVFKLMLLFILNVVFVRGVNITEFDDGGSNFNITTNYTGFITIPVNATVTEANITLKGFLGDNKQWCSQDNAKTTNCTGQIAGNYSVHNINSNGTVLYINYSKPTSATNESRFEITHGNLATYNNSIPKGCWDYSNNSLLFRGFSAFWDDTPRLNGTSYFECLSSTGWTSIGNTETEPSNAGAAQGDNAAQNESYDDVYSTYYAGKLTPSITLILNCGSSTACAKSRLIEEAMHWYNAYTTDVLIKTNGTIMFNNTGNLTGTNSSIALNNTLIQNYIIREQTIQINFSASQFGILEISNLILTYNKTNSASLSILSPTQVSKSIASGASFTQAINVSNTGNWNATNISFEAISQSATANLNDSITHDCTNIVLTDGTSVICNVTFSSLTQSAESDEKLRVRSLGTDNNDVVYSGSIDLDVTITTTPQVGGGGGGGGGVIIIDLSSNVSYVKILSKTLSSVIDLIIASDTTREIDYELHNTDVVNYNYRIDCVGQHCEKIKLNQTGSIKAKEIQTHKLLINTNDLAEGTRFVVTLELNVGKGKDSRLDVYVNVNRLGYAREYLLKFVNSKNLGGIFIPNILVYALFGFMLSFVPLALLANSKQKPIFTFLTFIIGLILTSILI